MRQDPFFSGVGAVLEAAVVVVVFAVATSAQVVVGQSVVADAVSAIGAGDVESFRFEASGSGYERIPAEDGDPNDSQGEGFDRRYSRIRSYVHEVDLGTSRAEVEIVRSVDSAETVETRSVDTESSWEEQLAIWMNPYAFLAEASTRNPDMETVEVYGEAYTRIRFDGPAGRAVEGDVSNEDGRLERIRTWIDGREGDREVPVEYTFRFYEETDSGHWFPGLIVRKVDDHLERILSVLDVTVNAAR